MKVTSLASLPQEGVSHDPQLKKQVILRRGQVPHLMSFSRSCVSPGQTTSPHAHADMVEVFLVQSGRGVLTVDGQKVALSADICVTIEPGETHEIACHGDEPLTLLYFGVQVDGESANDDSAKNNEK